MISKRYLITGGTGFIGAHLTQQLAAAGHTPVVLTRQGTLPHHVTQLLDGCDVEVVRGDLMRTASFAHLLSDVDGVFHLAGFISTRKQDAQKVIDLNATISHNLFDALASKPVKRVVYLASIFALAGGDPTPVTESTPYNLDGNPVGYFHAKRSSELHARKLAHDGMDIVLTYPCFCLGPGDALVSSSRPLLLYLQRRAPATFAGGWNVMDVRDAAAGLIRSMDHGRAGEQYILGGENMTFPAFYKQAEDTLGLAAPPITIPNTLAGVLGAVGGALVPSLGLDRQSAWMAQRYWYYDDRKARNEIGHRSRPLQQTLQDAAMWFAEHGFCAMPARAT